MKARVLQPAHRASVALSEDASGRLRDPVVASFVASGAAMVYTVAEVLKL